MINVKFSFPYNFPIIRQTPGSSGIWKNVKFYINEHVEECDYWVVYDNLLQVEKAKCPANNIILITPEPSTVKRYNGHFVKQFGMIVTCQKDNINHPNLVFYQQALPWMAGMKFISETKEWDTKNYKNYDTLSLGLKSIRNNKLAIITSNKKFTDGHRTRLEFIHRLKDTLGDRFDIYGEGFQPVGDKLDIIKDYKYMLVIENAAYENYWTEKLSDTFLGEAYPIYCGCTNIFDYFPQNSLSTIDINNVENSIEKIIEIINSDKYEVSLKNIQTSKTLILDKYNLFELIKSLIDREHGDLKKKKVINVLKPQNMTGINSIIRRLKHAISKFKKAPSY